jgi:NAD(P)-dependent dehydrogenase (short-subunit alcohol dehydrogenase family)
MELHGRTTIVTGANSGIGRELAIKFGMAGANVVCCGRTEAMLHETVERIAHRGGTGLVVRTDVSRWTQVQKMVHLTLNTFGSIDVLFNNAGSFQYVGPVWEADPEVWWQDVTINLYGSMLCCRAVLPHMMERNAGICPYEHDRISHFDT